MYKYIPEIREEVKTVDVPSGWGNIPTILLDIIQRFGIKREKALEFGVEWGYSTSAISNYFDKVIGVDTFLGDKHSGVKPDHYLETKEILKDYKNIDLIQSSYEDFIKTNDDKYDLIHIDIIHEFKPTLECAEWSIQRAPIVLIHDTMIMPEEIIACRVITGKYEQVKFYNYEESNGLAILFNPDLL